jgi:chitinase
MHLRISSRKQARCKYPGLPDFSPNTRARFLTDPWADTGKPLGGGSSDDPSGNLHGCLEQLYLLKKQNQALKVLLSVGSWEYSSHFALPASTLDGRMAFASSVVSLVRNYGLDGVDIDWEYPADASEGENMVALLQAVRAALDAYGNSLAPPYPFTLTAACPAPYGYQYLSFSEMNKHIDFCNFMGYDYTGPWSNVTGDQSNLFPSLTNQESTPYSTEDIISHISPSIPLDKIVLGIPLYGRAFNNTAGPGESFTGSRTYDFKDLPLKGCDETYNKATGSSQCYGNREWISYDSIPVVQQKASFIQDKTLAGAMFWESSTDGSGDQSIMQTVADALGGKNGAGLDKTPNQLVYPDSPYNNILKSTTSSSHSSVITSGLQSSHTSSHTSSSKSTSTAEPSPSDVATITNCGPGSTYYEYQNLKLCTCGLDSDGKLLFYDPEALCGMKSCGTTNAPSTCAENEACMPNLCEDGISYCAPVIVGCQDFPKATALVFNGS